MMIIITIHSIIAYRFTFKYSSLLSNTANMFHVTIFPLGFSTREKMNKIYFAQYSKKWGIEMKKYLGLFIVVLFMNPAIAATPRPPSPKAILHSDKDIYIDITEVHGPDGTMGTSADLNVLISRQATRTGSLEHRFHSFSAPDTWSGIVRTYDRHNIKYKQGYKKCNYSDALRCGIMNKHWTILTHVTVGSRYSVVTMTLYNERGQVISSAQKTAWGKVRWVPKWKITRTTDSGNCVDAPDPTTGMIYQRCSTPRHTSVYEEWPPEMKELPPLVVPYHIHQVVAGLWLSLTRDFMKK